jgi:FlaA1/EpsC-like NDP-sugar epimerase
VVLLPWGSSHDHDRADDARPALPSERALATAKRLVADALASLRFHRRGLRGAPEARLEKLRRLTKQPLAGVDGSRLLGREPITFQIDRLRPAVSNRAILVTGAAGSIGSELCRQIAQLQPRLVVAFDQAESGLFQLDQDMRRHSPGVTVVPWIGDIRDVRGVQEVIERYTFDSVFHAAAYKHVPLMELHPLELIQTNVLGTWNLARAAANRKASRFTLISTDKAVNPGNVMGLTKRIAELLVAQMAGDPGCRTRFATVRFGNVLGSSGSVVPLFHEQIALGGPLTVTHPDVRRYFMTIREAVHLVLETASMADGSGTFVLDMGEPVRIVELARNMIRMWGLEPDKDIEIRYVGLRPGEKLNEELIGRGEQAMPTLHPRIRALRGNAEPPPNVDAWMAELRLAVERRDEAGAISYMAALAPEYEPGEIWAALRTPPAASRPAAAS